MQGLTVVFLLVLLAGPRPAEAATARQRLESLVDMHALDRIGTEEEIAEAVAYLVCAEWTTGALIDVDGGLGLGLTRA